MVEKLRVEPAFITGYKLFIVRFGAYGAEYAQFDCDTDAHLFAAARMMQEALCDLLRQLTHLHVGEVDTKLAARALAASRVPQESKP